MESGSRGSACRILEGMENVVACVSGYHGRERFKLIKLITRTGAHYVGTMARSTTHLVCWEFDGKKYNLAKSFGTKIVSHRWFEDCLKKGRRISDRPYIMQSGKEVGPILWDIPEKNTENKRKGEISDDYNHGKKSVIYDLSDTFDEVIDHGRHHERSEREIPLSDLFDKGPSLSDLVEGSKLIHGRSRKLSKKIRTESTSLVLPEMSHRSRRSDFVEIHGCSSFLANHIINNERPEQANHSPEKESMVGGSEDTVVLNSSQSPRDFCNEAVRSSSGSTSSNPRAESEVSPQNSFRSPSELSCVICWTEFSSIRGVLACGHRFCYECIKGWADRMMSKKKVSTCPLCKASFSTITRVESTVSSDQKIYSQTIPSSSSEDQFHLRADGNSFVLSEERMGEIVCHECQNQEPEDQLHACHLCRSRWVHSCCLDPPVLPWTCVHCRDLRVLYQLFRS
ncbi:zinc finger (C3HC4-type RING finger) family protein / BRCT domain-containing protein [Wolffia australiana]